MGALSQLYMAISLGVGATIKTVYGAVHGLSDIPLPEENGIRIAGGTYNITVAGDNISPIPVTVTMPCCGRVFDYPTEDSFPKESVPCPCGAKDRWVVFYEDRETP